MRGRDRRMVPVTGGMALEAITHAGTTCPDPVLGAVLNDNDIDLHRPVGALSRTLKKPHAAEPAVHSSCRHAEEAGKNLPFLHASCRLELKTLKESMKRLACPSWRCLEELGLTYMGPVRATTSPRWCAPFQAATADGPYWYVVNHQWQGYPRRGRPGGFTPSSRSISETGKPSRRASRSLRATARCYRPTCEALRARPTVWGYGRRLAPSLASTYSRRRLPSSTFDVASAEPAC